MSKNVKNFSNRIGISTICTDNSLDKMVQRLFDKYTGDRVEVVVNKEFFSKVKPADDIDLGFTLSENGKYEITFKRITEYNYSLHADITNERAVDIVISKNDYRDLKRRMYTGAKNMYMHILSGK